MSTTRSPRAVDLVRKSTVAAVFFWLVQICFGLPSLGLAATMMLTGKAEGALFSISLFLVWIGATLSVAVATIIHGKSTFPLPRVFPVEVVKERVEIPLDFDQEFQGYPYKMLAGGKLAVYTDQGLQTYPSWKDFMRSIGVQ